MQPKKYIFLLPFCSLPRREKVEKSAEKLSRLLSSKARTFLQLTVCTADGIPRFHFGERVVILAGSKGIEGLFKEYLKVNRDTATVIVVTDRYGGLSAVLNARAEYGLPWPIVVGYDLDRIDLLLELQARSLLSRESVLLVDDEVLDQVVKKYSEYSGSGLNGEEALYRALAERAKGYSAVGVNCERLRFSTGVELCNVLLRLDGEFAIATRPSRELAILRYVLRGLGPSAIGDIVWKEGQVYEVKICVGSFKEVDYLSLISVAGRRIRISNGGLLRTDEKRLIVRLDSPPGGGTVIIVPRRTAELLTEVAGLIERIIFRGT